MDPKLDESIICLLKVYRLPCDISMTLFLEFGVFDSLEFDLKINKLSTRSVLSFFQKKKKDKKQELC